MITFDFKLEGHGWAQASFSLDDHTIEMVASYLNDAPRDLIEAVITLFSKNSSQCYFSDEPGLHRLRMQKGLDQSVTMTIQHDNEETLSPTFNPIEDRFHGETTLQELAKAILRPFDSLIESMSPEEYEESWMWPFPQKQVSRLKRLVSKTKQRS